jgi:hypothetical protein
MNTDNPHESPINPTDHQDSHSAVRPISVTAFIVYSLLLLMVCVPVTWIIAHWFYIWGCFLAETFAGQLAANIKHGIGLAIGTLAGVGCVAFFIVCELFLLTPEVKRIHPSKYGSNS